jgi:hypothetical protein
MMEKIRENARLPADLGSRVIEVKHSGGRPDLVNMGRPSP